MTGDRDGIFFNRICSYLCIQMTWYFPETVEGLQLLLNELSHYRKILCINVENSNIVVLRNKGKIKLTKNGLLAMMY